jgi:hypothetical protein
MAPRFKLILLVLACVLGCEQLAQACSCRPRGEACEAAWRVDAVFSGEATLILPTYDGDFIVRFRIIEHFRGIDPKVTTVWVSTPIGGSACGFDFKRGKSYLVYGWKTEGVLASFGTGICSRTWPLEHAQQDVAYLRTIEQQPLTSRIFGTFKLYTFDEGFVPKAEASIMDHYSPPEEELYALRPLANAPIRIEPLDGPSEARKALITQTDQVGAYTAEVGAGSYSVSATSPPGYTKIHSRQVTAYARGCASASFRAEADGVIAGKLLTLTKKPLGRVMVYLTRARDGDTAVEPFRYEMTEPDGSFRFSPVPEGQFLLGINSAKNVWIEANQGLERRYYPDATSGTRAKVFQLKAGQKVEGIVFYAIDKSQ